MTSTLSGTVELKKKGRCFGQNSNAKSCPAIQCIIFFSNFPLLVVDDVLSSSSCLGKGDKGKVVQWDKA